MNTCEEKPQLRLIQIPVTERCNLNCKGCNLLFNDKSDKMIQIKEYEEQINGLLRLFSGVRHIILLGGEPLLHPNLGELMVITRKRFPESEIEIRTNGILINRLEENILKAIAETGTEIVVSVYPPMEGKTGEISKVLCANGIKHHFIGPFYQFRKIFNPKGDYDPEQVYKKCDKCINLFNGELSCGFGYLIEKLEKKYNTVLCKNEDKKLNRIDIHSTKLSGKEINQLIETASRLCSYCAYQNKGEDDEHILFSWSCGKEPNLEDWIV